MAPPIAPVPARKLPALFNPKLNPTGYMAAASAIYAAVAMIWNATHNHGVFNVAVIITLITAVSALGVHTVVTPVAAPKDGNGTPLVVSPVPETGWSGPRVPVSEPVYPPDVVPPAPPA